MASTPPSGGTAWTDRTGRSHPDYGRLTRDPVTDTVTCHVCGRSFRALGAHVRTHMMSADEYRAEFGLLRTRALSARSLSQERSAAQRQVYAASERAKENFSSGRAMARSGELARRRLDSFRQRPATEELLRRRADNLAAGHRTQSKAAQHRLAATVARLGFPDVHRALLTLYDVQGCSFDQTALHLGIGKAHLRTLLAKHDITVRPSGHNTPTGKRSRVALNEREAALRVGTADIAQWLAEQTAGGATLRQLATATGRSIPWVAARLSR